MQVDWASTDDAQAALDQIRPEGHVYEAVGLPGGQRRVFRGELAGTPVAVKILRPWGAALQGQAARVLEYSRREVAAMLACHSPHMARVIACGEVELPNGLHSICQVEEFITGHTLREAIAERRGTRTRFPAYPLQPLALGVAEAIAAMWAQRCVHRDIKPENIMLRDADRGVVLVDLGICLSIDLTRLTNPGEEGPHTPGYQSPEQIRQEARLDHRSDQFLLGISLYECATGVHPFRTSRDEAQIREMILRVEPPDLRARPGLSGPMVRVIQQLLSKHRTNRYPTPEQLLEALA